MSDPAAELAALGDPTTLGLGAVAILLVVALLKSRDQRVRPSRSIPRAEVTDVRLERLQGKIKELESEVHGQREFFVNFPEVVKSLTAAIEVGQVLSACSRASSTLLHTRTVAIFVADAGGNLQLVDGVGFAPELRNKLTISPSDAVLAEMLQQYGVTDLRDHAGGAARERLKALGIDLDVAAPVFHGSNLLGLLLVGGVGKDTQSRRVLAMIADLTGIALWAAKQVGRIKVAAENDELTGIANRRTLMAKVDEEIRRATAYGTRVSLAMIDVDHFKKYNDNNGHQAGDEVLKLVASIATSTTRRTDLFARYGGEEFSALLVGADRAQAIHHAERIRLSIEGQAFPRGDTQPLGRVSVSIGVATFPDDARDLESLFKAADEALYRSKDAGRNRVTSFSGVQG